jgi:multiple sugar transport system permease protein/putative aldouronate transport system permease protein
MPLWTALVSSFTNEGVLFREGYRLWIKDFDLTSYKVIFTGTNDVMSAYLVTIATTAAGVGLTLLLTSSLAYPLSVPALKYRHRIAFFAYFTMLFNGGLVPNYILTTRLLHMRNSIWVLIIPGALNAYNMFLMRNYFASIPQSLSESAKIDGANELRIYWSIILPLAKPILATIGLFAAMGYWNEWYKVLLYIDKRELFTLQFLIMRLQQQADFLSSSMNPMARQALGNVAIPTLGVRLATAMVSIGPIVLLYPLLQKYFIKGIMIGSVKG